MHGACVRLNRNASVEANFEVSNCIIVAVCVSTTLPWDYKQIRPRQDEMMTHTPST
jgi:hypothetical protein